MGAVATGARFGQSLAIIDEFRFRHKTPSELNASTTGTKERVVDAEATID